MLKKIRSNRNPGDTLFREVRREFGRYFLYAEKALERSSSKHPRRYFYTMVFAMFLSMILSFTFFRNRERPRIIPVAKIIAPASDGFERILQTTGEIRQTLALKKIIDSIASKKTLSSRDSLLLDSALNRFREIRPIH
jgi:hypothetical protein